MSVQKRFGHVGRKSGHAFLDLVSVWKTFRHHIEIYHSGIISDVVPVGGKSGQAGTRSVGQPGVSVSESVSQSVSQ